MEWKTELIDITREFVQSCLQANEMGDAKMYIALNQQERLYNQTSNEWMRWTGHHWDIDKHSSDAMSAMEKVVVAYLDEAKALVDEISNENDTDVKKRLISRQKDIYRRVDRLRSVRGTNNCLEFTTRCKERLVVNNDDFDRDPWSLPMQNGVVDLKTGDIAPGRQQDLLMKACPHQWHGIDAKAPLWEQSIMDIMAGDPEMVAFLERLFGYSITGLSTEHILPVFWGKGRNGKSVLVETLRYVLGPLAAPIRPEMLLDQAFMRSSSGPSPDIMGLKGLRIAFATETDEGRRISPSQVKLLTGADTLVARAPHDRYETRFDPTHTLYLLTNNRPQAPADDFAFWKRIVMVPFQVSFVDHPISEDERPIDKFLGEKLKAEAPGILAWLVRGCLSWQRYGLDYPTLVSEATGEYRRNEDMLADFIDECCVTGEGFRARSSDIYSEFQKWFETNYGKRIPSQKRFGGLMAKKFERRKEGVYFYYGVALAENGLI